MPLTSPRQDESQDEFISRCLSDDTMKEEYPDQDQRTAVCYRQWRDAQNNASGGSHTGLNLHNLNADTNYEIRERQYNERTHIVVPAVLMVEGVHNGSHGPTLYTRDELQKFPWSWNGEPVTVFHPEDEYGPISANDPNVLERHQVGYVFNAHYVEEDGLGKLRGELWIDRDRCNQLSPAALAAINQRRRLDVSTGLGSEDQQTTGVYNNETYYGVARNIRPDHLALLPGAVGACSWEDGCGVRLNEDEEGGGNSGMKRNKQNRNKKEQPTVNASTPNYSGTSSADWSAPDLSDFDVEGNTWDDLSQQDKAKVAGHFLVGSASVDNFEDLTFPVVEPSSGNLNENALRAVIRGRGSEASISSEELSSARRIAYRLLNEQFDADLEVPEDLAANEESGGKDGFKYLKANSTGGYMELIQRAQRLLDSMDTSGRIHFLEDLYSDSLIYRVEIEGEGTKLFKRPYSVSDNGQVTLEGEPVEVVEKTEYVEANSATETPSGKENKQNKEQGGTKTMDKREEKVQAIIANEQLPFTEDNRPCLDKFTEEQLDTIAANGGSVAANSDGGDNGDGQVTQEQVVQALREHLQDKDQFLQFLPEEVREDIQDGLQVQQERKQNAIKTITDNSDFTEEELKGKPRQELEKLANSLKPTNYAPMGGGQTTANAVGGPKVEPVLPVGVPEKKSE